MFGEERMKVALSTGPRDPEALTANLLQAVQQFTSGAMPSDDITLLACQRRAS